MRFFTVFAALALAAVSYASPIAAPQPAPVNEHGLLTARHGCDGCKPLPAIIMDVTAKVNPLVDQLKTLPAEKCTGDVIKPIVGELKDCINGAIVEVNALVGLSVNVVLSTSTGILGLSDFCNLIATLYTLIFGCFGAVLNICVSAELDVVIGLFAEVGVLLGTLLHTILGLVGGILVILKPLLAVCLSVIVQTGCGSAFAFLGIGAGISL